MRTFERLNGVLLLVLLLLPLFFMPLYSAEPFKVPAEVTIVICAWIFAVGVETARALGGEWPLAGMWRSDAVRWVLAFAGWCLLASAIAVLPKASFAYAGTVLAYVVAGLAALDWQEDAPLRRQRWILGGLAVLVGLESFTCVLQLWHFDFVGLGQKVQPGGYFAGYMDVVGATSSLGTPIGTFGNVNYSAEFFAITIPMMLGWALTIKNPKLRWSAVASLLVPLGVLIATKCRAAFGGLLIFAPVAAVLIWGRAGLDPRRWVRTERGRNATMIGAFAALIAFAVAGRPMLTKLMAMRNLSGLDIESRAINWRAATTIWREHRFTGAGLGSFKVLDVEKLAQAFPNGLPPSASSVRFYEAHNEPVQILAELGVIGLTLIVLALMAWVEETQANETLPMTARFGLLWGVGAVIFASCFGFPFHIPLTALVFTFAIALGVSRPKQKPAPVAIDPDAPLGEAEERPLSERPVRQPLAVGKGVAVALVLVIFATMDIGGDAVPLYRAYAEQYDASAASDRSQFELSDKLYKASMADNRFKGTVLTQVLLMLWRFKRYQEILDVYDANQLEGPGMDAMTVKADAFLELHRYKEASGLYDQILHYYSPDHPNYQRAVAQMARIRAVKP